MISLLGIGLAIDYALFVISRFREELALLPVDDPEAVSTAIRRTMTTAGRTVLFSGLTVAAALSSLLIFPQAFLKSMGYGGMAAVLVAMVAALTVLPATLRLLGRRVDAGRLPWRRKRPVVVDDAHGRWAALARGVMRRPWLVIVGTVAGLLLIASPFLGAKWGSVDYRVLPSDAPAHVAADKLSDFGPETSTAQLLVRGASEADVTAYAEQVAEVDGVTGVQPVATEGDATLLRASWAGNSQSEHSQAVIEDIRDVQPASGEVLVGGLSADTVDLIDSVGAHLPWMGLIVALVMLVLLFVAFGSLVLPVKAVVMNLFSITASFGVVTWIFSDGHLSGLLGLHAAGLPRRDQPDPDAGHPVRAVDGLRGVPALADPRAVGPHGRQRPRGRDRRAEDRPDHHQRRGAARCRDRGVRAERHRVHEDARHRHARRAAGRRDRGPRPPGPGHDEAARPLRTGGPPAR